MKKGITIIVVLISLYVMAQAISDIAATRMIQIGTVVMPSGTLLFALTFTLRDLIHKRLGKEWAKATIIMAGALNILQAGYLLFVSKLNAPVFYALDNEWKTIFAIIPSITIASIIAEIVSELIDTEIYHAVAKKLTGAKQIFRVLISNAVSLPVDSFIFALLGFVLLPMVFGGESYSLKVALSLVAGQIIYKAIITLVSSPLIYLVKDKPIEIEIKVS